jgi:Cu+-exporting ATPase
VKRPLDLQPDTARVLRNGREEEVPIEAVTRGELVRIRPGERLPVDGEVVEGPSPVDQALVTGEPIPVERGVGDSVIGGSINRTGTLLVRVTASGQESFLQRIARQVEDARALKPGILHLVDRVLVVYTPTVLAVALLAVLGWVTVPRLLGNEPDLQRAVFAGLSVLVMGYPCAVGISAPLPIVRGTGEAAERGILMRTGEAFQGYRLVTQIALDKTGILTEGRPRLIEIEASGIGENELIALGAGVEVASEHPLADAIVTTAFGRGLTPPEVEHFAAVPGKGVRARVVSNRLDAVGVAREISRRSYRKMLQNVSLAFLFNGIGVPLAATGLIYPIWAMAAMAASVTTIFVNSLSAQP